MISVKWDSIAVEKVSLLLYFMILIHLTMKYRLIKNQNHSNRNQQYIPQISLKIIKVSKIFSIIFQPFTTNIIFQKLKDYHNQLDNTMKSWSSISMDILFCHNFKNLKVKISKLWCKLSAHWNLLVVKLLKDWRACMLLKTELRLMNFLKDGLLLNSIYLLQLTLI